MCGGETCEHDGRGVPEQREISRETRWKNATSESVSSSDYTRTPGTLQLIIEHQPSRPRPATSIASYACCSAVVRGPTDRCIYMLAIDIAGVMDAVPGRGQDRPTQPVSQGHS